LRSGRGRLVGDCCNSVTKITRRCFSGKTRPPASPRRWPSLGPPVCKNARPLFSEPRIGAPKISSSSGGLDARRHPICDPGHRSYDLSHGARRPLRGTSLRGENHKNISRTWSQPGSMYPNCHKSLNLAFRPASVRVRGDSVLAGPATGLVGRKLPLICAQTVRLPICQPRVTCAEMARHSPSCFCQTSV